MNVLIQSDGSYVVLFPGWLSTKTDDNNDYIYNTFREQLEYEQPLIKQMFTSNIVPTPRLQYGAGDTGVKDQRYSTTIVKTVDWTHRSDVVSGLRNIRNYIANDQDLMLLSDNSIPNSCLVNYYRNGNDSVGLHDDKGLTDKSQTVYTVTLGQPRPFRLIHNITKEKVQCVPQPGDLLIMTGNSQRHWKHEIPKRSANKYNNGRISLTYRAM